MKCREVRRLIFLYLDSELDPRTVQEVNLHLEVCGECRDRWSFESSLEESVERAAWRAGEWESPDDSAAGARARFDWKSLEQRLRSGRAAGRRSLLVAALALFCVGLCVAAWWTLRPETEPARAARSAIAHHLKYLAGKSPVQVDGPLGSSVEQFFSGELGFDAIVAGSSTIDRRELVGARRCAFLKRPVAYVIYRLGETPVTVILGPEEPPESLVEAITQDPDGVLRETHGDHAVVFSTVHSLLFAAVGKCRVDELLALLQSFRREWVERTPQSSARPPAARP